MALPHAASGDLIPLRREGDDLANFTSIALAKTESMELIRLVLPKGRAMPSHAIERECTLLCLHGSLVVEMNGRETRMAPSELMWIAGRQQHAVRAEEDAVALLTILLGSSRHGHAGG
ncbi:hypothetical protein [Massilia sp. TS11]|uniref:hypothetical protein n=1 Tax=Massilia sp. TS11 TaxID=2908003 RepID=UPI001EDBAF5D|nr:hypothetical protein [Massilia sp. TS11]MCG2585845.1 hypothetical protein [Massilia sp. TS11]